MTPARGKLFVRPVETPETLGGGKILLTEETRHGMTSGQFEVVSVGAPNVCEDEDCGRQHFNRWAEGWHHVLGIQAGDWVLVRHRSLSETHQDKLYCCSQDDVLARLEQ